MMEDVCYDVILCNLKYIGKVYNTYMKAQKLRAYGIPIIYKEKEKKNINKLKYNNKESYHEKI